MKSRRCRFRARLPPDFSATVTPAMCRALNGEVWQQVQIKLLIFDPDGSPISDQQEAIIRNQLRLLKTHILRDYSKVEIRMYSTPASLRGRRFGNLLNVGWYTYFHHEGGIDLEGGGNPMLLIDAANTTEGSTLADMFEQAFEEAWENGRPYNL